jgi:AraC-like DNA-binding protein
MAEALTLLPALTLRAQMQGLAALGVDMRRIHAAVGPVPDAPDAFVPAQAYRDMWAEAHLLYPSPGLPTALAMSIPFGAFGALDYLAGTADTVAGCCESAELHFAMVASDTWLKQDVLDEGSHVLQVCGAGDLPQFVLEFTLAALISRLRYVTAGKFVPQRAGLPVPKPQSDPLRERVWGSGLIYEFPTAEIQIDAATWASATASADPYLHATLKRMAEQLQIAQPGDTPLERALRMRLRGALAQGQADSARLAALLGVSERTLQRRLADVGRSVSEIVEDFRREEAARLLCDPRISLVEVAGRLGYSEQTSFTRAFRRWTGSTPGAWRSSRIPAGSKSLSS